MFNAIKNSLKRYSGILLTVIIAIILYQLTKTINPNKLFGGIFALFKPFIYGALIAYILSHITAFFQNHLFGKIGFLKKHKRLPRTLSMATTYVLLIVFIIFMTVSIIPEIVTSVSAITYSISEKYIPEFEKAVNIMFNDLMEGGRDSYTYEIFNSLRDYITKFLNTLLNNMPDLMGSLVVGTYNLASWSLSVIISIIISVYILTAEDGLKKFAKNVFYIILPKKQYGRFIDFVKYANNTFEKFFIGKAIDSIIIGIIFFFGCSFISPDYALFFAFIIGITNMIPYFGPFIGAVPVVIICFLQQPYSALWMALFIFILQQFDGYILGPRVLGESIGISPLGVIFSILIGGSLFNFWGMFFGVPVFAVLSNVIVQTVENRRLIKQQKEREDFLTEKTEEEADEKY